MFVPVAITMWIVMRGKMKTVQMTLDEDLLKMIDRVVNELKTTRSAFIRESVQYYIERLRIKELENKHQQGYSDNPVQAGEFDGWEDEQAWGD